MALEDAAVLARLLDGVADQVGLADAFRRFEVTRKERTSRVQLTSRTNTWLHDKTDVDWVYSYNPWTTPLAALVTVGNPAAPGAPWGQDARLGYERYCVAMDFLLRARIPLAPG